MQARANCPVSGDVQWGQLAYVVDGDTIRLKDGRRLRLIAVNTPELGHNGRSDQPLAREAKRQVEHFFAADRRVGLQAGKQGRDHYGRYLMHVYRGDGQSLSAWLLARGLGWRIAIPPNLDYQGCLQAEEQRARQAHLGVWAAYPPKPTATLGISDTGFEVVTGTVHKVTETRSGWWVDMDGLSLRVSKKNSHYFEKNLPNRWQGRQVIVRGWVIDRGDSAAAKKRGYPRFMMPVSHPSMLSFTNPAGP